MIRPRLKTALKDGRALSKFTLVDGRRVVLREAGSGDLNKLLAFINGLVSEKKRDDGTQLFTGFESRVTKREEARWLNDLVRRIRNGDTISVLAELDGQVVGNGEIARDSYRETRHHGHLALTLRGEYRGLGIGREIVRVLLAVAKRRGLRTVHVEFLSRNKHAARVYEKAGFKRVGGIPGMAYRNEGFLDSLIVARRL